MNNLEKAKELAGKPGQQNQLRSQTYAAIALVEAVQDQTRKLVSAIEKLVAPAQPVAEKKAAPKRATRAKAAAE